MSSDEFDIEQMLRKSKEHKTIPSSESKAPAVVPGPESLPEVKPEIPVLVPIGGKQRVIEVEKPQGFGFLKAILWCIMYVMVMQVLVGVVIGLPIILIAMAIEGGDSISSANMQDSKALMESPTVVKGMMIVLCISHFIGLLMGVLALRMKFGRSWARKSGVKKLPGLNHFILCLIGFVGIQAVAACIEPVVMKYIPSIQDMLNQFNVPFSWPGIESFVETMKTIPIILAVVAIAVHPGVNEEFWCRGFLSQGMSHRYRPIAVILLTSILFGVIHLEPRQGFIAMLLGISLHGIYFAIRSIWLPVFFHFLNNAMAVIHVNQKGYPVLSFVEDAALLNPLFTALAGSLVVVAVGYALFQTRVRMTSGSLTDAQLERKYPCHVEAPEPGSKDRLAAQGLSIKSIAFVLVSSIALSVVILYAEKLPRLF